jgi:hypothetical protein
VSETWAASIPRSDADSLGRLWRAPGIVVCEKDDRVWLRGHNVGETTEKILRTLPGVRRFTVLPDRQLVPVGKVVPHGNLPEQAWVDLTDWISVQLPTSGFNGVAPNPMVLSLVRSHVPSEANVLVTTWNAWYDFATEVAQFRLDPLSFAMAEVDRVAVRGGILPPIRGDRFVERQGVAAPVGWTWTPSVDADVVHDILQLESNDLALLHPNGEWDHIRADDFVRASRSAVRVSMGGTSDA